MELPADEQQQILQTIEMFEVIAEADPDDYQSLSLLKEAYSKLGRTADVLRIGRRLGDAYTRTGQTASAIRELEEILQRTPDDEELSQRLDELVHNIRLPGSKVDRAKATPQAIPLTEEEIKAAQQFEASLIITDQTQLARSGLHKLSLSDDDGNDQFGRFLANNNLVPADRVKAAVEAVRVVNSTSEGTVGTSLIDELCRNQPQEELEKIVTALLDRTRFPYIPLEYYDVDRNLVKLLPEEICLRRLIVPFDQISRSMMIAISNPFDSAAKEAVQQLLDYDVHWYFAMPSAIAKVLAEGFRLALSE